MRHLLIALPLLLGTAWTAQAQVSVGIGVDLPGVRIGINLPAYPNLQRVPGYPVYYAPQAAGNYFFYDGLYWVFEGEDWYASNWYNGPWRAVDRYEVPSYVLRVPVRYYRQPPVYFRAWRPEAPPRWGEHWGNDWQRRRPDWDRWDRRRTPAPAPLPTYQRKYPQSRYPVEVQEQQNIRQQNDRYRPRDPVVRQQAPERAAPRAPEQREAAPPRGPQNSGRPNNPQQSRQNDRKDDRKDDRQKNGGKKD
jgi:hypothetical protein